jgi:hypothetical protein
MITISEPTIVKQALLEPLIQELKVVLKNKFSWLSQSFGRAQKLIRVHENELYSFPGIYIGNGKPNDYFEAVPNDRVGNFCFWDIQQPYEAREMVRQEQIKMTARGGVVFWVDLSTIYTLETGRALDYVKAEVWRELMFCKTTKGTFRPEVIHESWTDIYNGYSLTEADGQFLMHPYGAFRIDGEFQFSTLCRTA